MMGIFINSLTTSGITLARICLYRSRYNSSASGCYNWSSTCVAALTIIFTHFGKKPWNLDFRWFNWTFTVARCENTDSQGYGGYFTNLSTWHYNHDFISNTHVRIYYHRPLVDTPQGGVKYNHEGWNR